MKLIALLSVSAALLAGCGGSSSGGDSSPAPASGTTTVDIKAFKYGPASVTVKKGARVRWVNADSAAHTSTADNRSFDTQTIDKGKAKTVAMTSPGTFPYHCDFHPFMKGTVVVK